VVYTTRTLINLPTWKEQLLGIQECLRVCKPNGRVIFSEAFWEPLVLLNSLRALASLPPLVEHDFNRYIKKSALEEYFRTSGIEFESVDFSSVYYLGSRFLRELVTIPENYPGYTNPINKIFFDIEREYSGGGFGIQQAYVVSK
jgi:SAM-dependent methyltransferase